jgi:hypothetical protein
MATNKAKAIGKSKWLPSWSKSAGARLTVIHLAGIVKPSDPKAARTLSRDSAIVLSGKPTMVKAGKPEEI